MRSLAPCLLARPAVPHPSHPYPLCYTVMPSPHRPAHRLAIRLLIVPRPVPRHARRGEVLANRCGAFHVRTMRYNPPSLLIPLLATSPHVYQSRWRLRRSVLTAGMATAAPIGSARLSAHPLRSHPPRPIDTRNGENDGAGLSSCLMRCGHPVCPPMRLRGSMGRRRLRFSYGCL